MAQAHLKADPPIVQLHFMLTEVTRSSSLINKSCQPSKGLSKMSNKCFILIIVLIIEIVVLQRHLEDTFTDQRLCLELFKCQTKTLI